MVGLNDDENKVLPSAFQEEGNILLLVGETKADFGASLYVKALHGETSGSLPTFDYKQELALWELVIEGNKLGLLESAKDVNVGGLAIAISKMAAVSGMGASVNASVLGSKDIFSESQSRAILEVKNVNMANVVAMAKELKLDISVIGAVGGYNVQINDVKLPLETVKDIYFNTFAKTIEQDI
jgi:phosphoribosylformylglycinamidine synthase